MKGVIDIDEKREQLRKAQLYIANEIKRICDKNGISYFLDCGSMLGAVRHHGFIPWDDDIDFGMLKKDYHNFLTIVEKELGDDFFIDNFSTNPENALVYSKVRLKGTQYLEAKGNANLKHNEIFVDIFPYYYISDNELVRKIEGIIMSIFAQAIMSKSGYRVWKGEGIVKQLKFIPTTLLGKCLKKETMHRIIDALYNKHFNTKRLCIHAGSCYSYWFFPTETFDNFVDAEFEGYSFKIPQNFHLYLSKVYGNYMELPPVENRVTHMIQYLDLGTYYFE